MTHATRRPVPRARPDLRFVVLADDLTSAAEAAGHAAATGRSSCVVLDFADPAAVGDPAVWPCVDLDSRALPPGEAAARHERVTGLVLGQPPEPVLGQPPERTGRGGPARAVGLYKTMDSSLRGNWPAELAAVMRASGRRVAVVAPACPAYDRRTVRGTQFAGGVPVHEGPAGSDPVRPVTESSVLVTLTTAGFRATLVDPAGDDLATALASAPGTEGGAAPQDTAPQGSAPQGTAPLRVFVVDASTEEDLARISAAVQPHAGDVVLCGSPGLWEALLPAGAQEPDPVPAGPGGPLPTAVTVPARRALVLVGSLHPTTRRQLARLAETGVPVLGTDELASHPDPGGCLAELLDAVPAVALATPEAVAADPATAARHLRDLAGLGARCARSLPGLGLVLSGGDTARELATALGAPAIRATGTLAPGIPLGVLTGPHPRPVVTKAGGFGGPDSLLAAVDAVTAPTARTAPTAASARTAVTTVTPVTTTPTGGPHDVRSDV